MKRKIAICLAMLMLWMPYSAGKAMPEVSSHSACVIDIDTGRILAAKKENEKSEPASITKIMTALIALENADIKKVVTIPSAAAGVEGSSIYIKAGEKYSLEDLLYGLMLRSGNDAATAIAIDVAGSVDAFVEKMNQKAQELGCTGTHFNNPHGLPDEKHYTTAHDMALITAAALRNDTFVKIVSTKNYTAEPDGAGETRSWQNKNKLLWQYEGAIGVKTGYTKSAGKTYVGAAERNGIRIAVVVLGAKDMWGDAATLLDDAFASYQQVDLIKDGQSTGVTPVLEGLSSEVEGITEGSLSKTLTKEEQERIVTKCVYQTPLYAPVAKGDIIGSMQVYLDDEMIGSVPIVAAADVAAYDFAHCLDKVIRQWITNLLP
ncbi:MAG: D-alanyl-D-alanine carboxypeptidase [Clostridiales bacterium]|nr:D-alanyl-D-alanine carboxypeptidase [Clostridiales bacterium]